MLKYCYKFQMLIILILLYIQLSYCYNRTITIDSIDKPEECVLNYYYNNVISKSEVLINNSFKSSQYYCNKDNDFCVFGYKYNMKPYINFRVKNGNYKTYISKTCAYTYNLTNCYGDEYKIFDSDESIYCSFKCTKDSDCLYNKCINNVCVYNEESSIIHCEEIYNIKHKYFEDIHTHCGKPHFENCTTDEECSSETCISYCSINNNQPSPPGDNTIYKILATLIFLIIISIFIISCLIYSCIRYIKNKNNN